MPRSWKPDPLSALAPPGRLGRGEVKLLLLFSLENAPRHGYELMKAVESLSGGRYRPSAGVIYPSLRMLAEQGLLKAEVSGERRRYGLTPAGRKHLASKHVPLSAAIKRLRNGPVGQRADLQALVHDARQILLILFGHPLAGLEPAQVQELRRAIAEATARVRRVLE